MGIGQDIVSKYRRDGFLGLVRSAPSYAYSNSIGRFRHLGIKKSRDLGVWASSRNLLGKNVFEEDWDMLVVLDTCRVDALRTVKDEYSFIDKVGKTRSVGGQSAEWIANTFDRRKLEAISDTAYITANPHSDTVFGDRLEGVGATGADPFGDIERLRLRGRWNFVTPEEMGKYDPVWSYIDDEGYGHPPPRYVTDRAIDAARSEDFERLILHYMPPHTPYVSRAKEEGRDMKEYEEKPMPYLKRTGDRKTVYDAYLHMLRWVLEDVELLLNNVDREKVVITADHGEAFGEHGVHLHYAGSLHPKIRNVPWVETSATDTEEYEPQFDPQEASERSVEDTLEALGYM